VRDGCRSAEAANAKEGGAGGEPHAVQQALSLDATAARQALVVRVFDGKGCRESVTGASRVDELQTLVVAEAQRRHLLLAENSLVSAALEPKQARAFTTLLHKEFKARFLQLQELGDLRFARLHR